MTRLASANHVISDDPSYDGDEWYTPLEYIAAARRVMGGIDLDPATSLDAQSVICAKTYYTKQDDGLSKQWFGNVWMNPPYSMPLIRLFVSKLIESHANGVILSAIVLTNNSSDTAWFHDLLARYPACFTRRRVRFWRPNHENYAARQGQAIFYVGADLDSFKREFGRFGRIVKGI